MPTAADYQLYAIRLGDTADELTGLTSGLLKAANPQAIMGGLLAVTVDLAVRASQANSLDAAGLLRQLAEECTRRQGICAEYDTAMDAYDARMLTYETSMKQYSDAVEEAVAKGHPIGSPPTAPSKPALPATWVERS